MNNKVFILEHPLIKHKITLLRDKTTSSKEFRELITEISMLMCYEATRDLPTKLVDIETPLCTAKCEVIAGRKIAIVPILRAGLGMVDGMLNLIPAAKVGHIGIYRDPDSHQPVDYYCKLPVDIWDRDVVVLDPMLATGGSAIDAVNHLKKNDVKNIKFMCIIASKDGIQALSSAHPDIQIYCGAQDEILNEQKYIIPGLGDAGDRIYGTK